MSRNLATIVCGPLAGPECRRALGRGWLILARMLAGASVFAVALVVMWLWWLGQMDEPSYRPYLELRTGLAIEAGMLVTVALVFAPAVMAGSLAGEKERGSIGLLLTTRVTAREIVSGRIAGKLAQVGMILVAGLPALLFLAALAGFAPGTVLAMCLLPPAVAFGGAGIAAFASTASRRGRDALLAVYLLDLFFLLSPLSSRFGLPSGSMDWVAALNPYVGLSMLVQSEQARVVWISIGVWTLAGLVGAGLASWWLRPACLRPNDGEKPGRTARRTSFVPPISERRPMVWKELFIERVGSLGRFGTLAGWLLVVLTLGGSVGLGLAFAYGHWRPGHEELSAWSKDQLGVWVGGTGFLMSCLIPWAVGLRAGVSISSERERGTWDALMTSPLEAREIVLGKLWGSLYAIRWLIVSAFVAWGLAGALRAVPAREVVRWGVEVLVVGAFMAAVGVRTSLICQTATRAMSLTIGAWLVSCVVVAFSSAVLLATIFLFGNLFRLAAGQIGIATPMTGIWMPLPLPILWPLLSNLVYLLATVLIVADTRVRFDRIAGRMVEGRVSLAFDELLYGRPMAPVLLGEEFEPGDGFAEEPRGEVVAESV